MRDKLTDKQTKFVKLITEGYSPTDSAALAGYKFPAVDASRLKNYPHVQKALYNAAMAALTENLLPKSLRRLDDILGDDSAAPSGVKLKAAQYVIDKAQALQDMANSRDILDKSPLDMTAAELEIFVARGRVVLMRESKRREAVSQLGIIDAEIS